MYDFNISQLIRDYDSLIALNNDDVGKYHKIFDGDKLLNWLKD
jgi:hypothetical protein